MKTTTRLKNFARNPAETITEAVRWRTFAKAEPGLAASMERVRAEGLTYLGLTPLRELAEAVLDVERHGLAGRIVEAGTALGGSAIVIAKAKAQNRPLDVYDAFGMIPPPGDNDGEDVHQRYEEIAAGRSQGLAGSGTYYGYRDDLLREVSESFLRHKVDPEANKVSLIKGLYEDTLAEPIEEPVALAHVDCDWYDSVMTCLLALEAAVVPGGRIVLDDYFHWSGARRAVDAWMQGRAGWTTEHRSRLHLVRTREES